MIASLLWKEYREHRAIWIALALVAFAAIIGLPWAFPPEQAYEQSYRDAQVVIAVVLAWCYGIVCGAMLLAGEHENGTQPFLDNLPIARLPVWLIKVLAGSLFLLLQVAVLALLGITRALVPPTALPVWVVALVYAGFLGLGWGLFYSARGGNVLGCIAMAFLAQFVLIPVMQLLSLIPIVFLDFLTGWHLPAELAYLIGAVVVLLLPWPVSALRYSEQDRARRPLLPFTGRTKHLPRLSWGTLLWLARQQMRGFRLGLLLFSFLAGFLVAAAGLFLWPTCSLLLGVLCGVTIFFDEQRGPYRFLGDQRFPLTRFWLVKMGMRLSLALTSLLVLLIPAFIFLLIDLNYRPLDRGSGESFVGRLFGSPLVGVTVPTGLFLFAPMVYGFTVGQVCGLVCRKPLVAVVVSFGLSVLLFSAWAPSFLTGGLRLGQVLVVPGVLIVAAWLLLRPWATDRLLTRTTVTGLCQLAVLVLGLTGVGLWYRVTEVGDVPEPGELPGFLAELPAAEHNEGGMATRAGLTRLETLMQTLSPLPPKHALEAIHDGWPKNEADADELVALLDKVFQDECWQRFAEARDKPTGPAQDPRIGSVGSVDRNWQAVHSVGVLLAARGLMLQHKGDPAAFLDQLDVALAQVRNLQQAGTEMAAQWAIQIEEIQTIALRQWLNALPHRADLLRRAGEILAKHRAWLPANYAENTLAEYVIAVNSLDQPQEWLDSFLHHLGGRKPRLNETELLATIWRIPWEQERQRRLLRAEHWNRAGLPAGARAYLPVVVPFRRFPQGRLERQHSRRLVRLEMARLVVALRHYQAENQGVAAKTLQALVPGYLAAVPEDPFARQSLRYRLSEGEEIAWGERGGALGPQVRAVPAGQGILWSVGEDLQDDDGKRRGGGGQQPTRHGEDLITLVPLAAR